jgi:hypothetical protein
MLEYVPTSGCLNGTAEEQILCLCTNTVLQAEITECVRPSCTTYDALCELSIRYLETLPLLQVANVSNQQ